MSWRALLAARRVSRHRTSREEIASLRAVVERDLRDAAVPGLSDDRRFATAYEAALQLARMAIACSGYRVKGHGAHATTFEALRLSLGPEVRDLAAYLDACRRKRNLLEYDAAHVVTSSEADELVTQAGRFRDRVERWIAEHRPDLS